MDWDSYRRFDESINLVEAFRDRCTAGLSAGQKDLAFGYLSRIEEMQPISSRQVAAQAIATAIVFAMQLDPEFTDAYDY